MRVGLTGGIGAGKSAVASLFADSAHSSSIRTRLRAKSWPPIATVCVAIARVWPQAIRNGVLDRAALAGHRIRRSNRPRAPQRAAAPHIRRLAFEREARAKPGRLLVHVVPLLFETGFDRLVDRSVLVVAPLEQRIARVVARDHLDEARVRARMAAQIEPARALEAADYIIENDGNLKNLLRSATAVYEALTGDSNRDLSVRASHSQQILSLPSACMGYRVLATLTQERTERWHKRPDQPVV